MTPREPGLPVTERLPRRWDAELTIAAMALAVGALIRFAGGHQDAVALLAVAMVLGIGAFVSGRAFGEQQRQALRLALRQADERARSLERLRRLAEVLLSARDVQELQQEVAVAAAQLLGARGAIVALLVEEGRYLEVAAASGEVAPIAGRLVPVGRSVMGVAIANEAPVVANELHTDPRSFHFEEAALPSPRAAAVTPLRSSGLVIGALAVYDRADGSGFTDSDVRLLDTLGGQVVLGLDRAAMLDESRRNEQVLAAKNRELQRATQLKSEFLANMSHELRTPLNAIIGFSDLLLSGATGKITPGQQDFLESVHRNGKHLLGLINNILDISKIEAGRMSLSLAVTDVREAIEGAVADTASLRAAKRQTCSIDVPTDDVLTVVADGLRIRQILFNLLSNASKFTPEGGEISLSALRTRAPLPIPAERASDRAGDVEGSRLMTREAIWIAVTDTGIGIKPEDMPKLFMEFSQVDSALSRQQQGTGLGLALSKSFVELHGGTIGVESLFGKGSSFWFILPVEGPFRRGASTMTRAADAAATPVAEVVEGY